MSATAWAGDLGTDWLARNRLSVAELDAQYLMSVGITRTTLNYGFLPTSVLQAGRILEVGTGAGLQLAVLRAMDIASDRLYGCDVNATALGLNPYKTYFAKADSLPFADASFDLVFTSGLLIHIPPPELPSVLCEIARVSRRWIWGYEYWSETPMEVNWRGRDGLLWKDDFPQRYLDSVPGLELVKVRHLPHRDASGNVDVMYIFGKGR